MTKRELGARKAGHVRRIKQLRDMGCPDTHPIIVWRLRRLADLQRLDKRPAQ